MDMTWFNPEDYEDPESFGPVPAGRYRVVAIDSETKDTKDGQGKYIKFTFQILEGEFQNRRLYHIFNVVNKSEQAAAIAHRMLKSLFAAVKKGRVTNSSELHDIPIEVEVGIRKDNEKYGPQNTIKSFRGIFQTSEKPPATNKEAKRPW